jgi:hypothetical protein
MRGRFLFLSCLHAFRNPVYLKLYVGITCSIRCVLHMKGFLVQMNSNWDMPELGRTKSDTALNEMKYSQNFWQFLCHVTIKVNRDLDVQLYTQCNGREKEIKRCHQYFKATSMDWRLLKLCTHFSCNRYNTMVHIRKNIKLFQIHPEIEKVILQPSLVATNKGFWYGDWTLGLQWSRSIVLFSISLLKFYKTTGPRGNLTARAAFLISPA